MITKTEHKIVVKRIKELEKLIRVAFFTNHGSEQSKLAHWESFKERHYINEK